MRFAILLTLLATATGVSAQSSSDFYSEEKVAARIAEQEKIKYLEILMTDEPDVTDLCVQSGIVSRAYLDAGNSTSYESWKKNEKYWCGKAGVR